MIPKQKAFRSKTYLKWIRTLPCYCCGSKESEAHHVIGLHWGLSGMGQKAPDTFCMPLCRRHHNEVHRDTEMQQQQPDWLMWVLRDARAEFSGDLLEHIEQAIEFIKRRESE